MNILLWILQVLLALHTVMGAVWKFSHSELTVPSLSAIPHGAWLGLSVAELFFSLCLVIPAFYKPLAVLAPIAAAGIAVEMLFYCGVHLHSGVGFNGQMAYWLIVAVLCAFIAYGRSVLEPL